MRGPWRVLRVSISFSAASVASTRSTMDGTPGDRRRGHGRAGIPVRSEEPEGLRAIAHQHVLGLLVVVEHDLVVLAADAGLLVAAEGRMGRIEVIAIGPDAAGLDAAAEAIGPVDIAGPNTGAEAVERVVGKREGFVG